MYGEFTVPAARYASHVYTIEPDPCNARKLRAATDHLSNVSVLNLGAWKDRTELSFAVTGTPSDTAVETIGTDTEAIGALKLPVQPLREFDWITDVDFVKIDAEGAEPEVLAGLGDHRPRTIRVDTSPERNGQSTTESVSEKLRDYGYEVWQRGKVTGGKLSSGGDA